MWMFPALQVSFKPDLVKFKMTHLDSDTVSLMTRRAYDIAGCTKGVAVHLNGERLPVRRERKGGGGGGVRAGGGRVYR